MKKQKLLALIFILSSAFFILSACSSTNSEQATKEATSEVQARNDRYYQNALSYLESGENKQAYDELNKVKESEQSKKVKELKKELGTLLQAKKAITAAKLTEAKKYLDKLADIDTPTALVKQVTKLNKEYQAVSLAKRYANEVESYYKAGNYSAAGGSLQALNSLESKYQAVAMYQDKEANYENLIATAQASAVKEQSSATSVATASTQASATSGNTSDGQTSAASKVSENPDSSLGYTNARNSKLLSSEYKKETGSDLKSAPDQVVSSMSSKMSNQDVLVAFQNATSIPQEVGDQYYVQDQGNGIYQIEIRHTSSSDPQVSNLKGMYRFDMNTKAAQKLNEISGQYENVN